MTIDLNQPPYYDDYYDSVDESNALVHTKGFNQILFKPGYAVQARELTQLQSILKDQIARFGSHVFKHGSVVIPGNSGYDLNVMAVRVNNISTIENYVGDTIVGASGLKAMIKAVIPGNSVSPATLVVSYYNTGTSGETEFNTSGEVLTILPAGIYVTTYSPDVNELAVSTKAAIAYVHRGVFFVNGVFAQVEPQQIVVSTTTNVLSAKILLKIEESIIDTTLDSTLLDPAQGTNNYAAPGADRLAINLTLVSRLLSDTTEESDYIELMRFNEGNLEEFNRFAKYNELEKNLARRTYDESGNYIAEGMRISVQENKNTGFNGGRYVSGDEDYLSVNVSKGKSYIYGFEVGLGAELSIKVPKARDIVGLSGSENHLTYRTTTGILNSGQYILVTENSGTSIPSFSTRAILNFYSDGVLAGTGRAVGIDYLSDDVYKLYIVVDSSIKYSDLSTVSWTVPTASSFKVVHTLTAFSNTVDFIVADIAAVDTSYGASVVKYDKTIGALYVSKINGKDIPIKGLTITQVGSSATAVVSNSTTLVSNPDSSNIMKIGTGVVKSIRDESSNLSISYKLGFYGSGVLSSGSYTFNASGFTFDVPDTGNITVYHSSLGFLGVYSASTVDGNSLTIASATPGTVHVYATVTKTDVTYKTKTLTAITDSFVLSASTATQFALTKVDGVRLKTITLNGSDVTSKFSFNGGQTDYSYKKAYISRDIGTSYTGTLLVTYEYYARGSSGDYFCVDSYSNFTDILEYTSSTTGDSYTLRNCLDFRTDEPFSNSVFVIPGSRISVGQTIYLPRIDSVAVSSSGDCRVEQGIPSETPVAPVPAQNSVSLATILVPAYTFSAYDVKIRNSDYIGYKMSDIRKLEDRIEIIENYSLIQQAEKDIINQDIVDASTGLARFKSGYLVDDFSNIDVISDMTNPDFAATYIGGMLYPAIERSIVDLETVTTLPTSVDTIDPSVGYSSGVITLPYTTKVFAEQIKSTETMNVNPYAVFSWKGQLFLTPSFDNFERIIQLPDININNVTYVEIPRTWGYQPEPGSRVTFPAGFKDWRFLRFAVRVHKGDTNKTGDWWVTNFGY